MPDYRSSRNNRAYYDEDFYDAPPRRRAPQRGKGGNGKLIAIIAIALVVIVAAVLALSFSGGKGNVEPQPTPTPAPETGMLTNATIVSDPVVQSAPVEQAMSAASAVRSSLAASLGDDDAELVPLPEEDRVQVTDLSLNESLPDNWMNILLLGSDERSLNESARTDTMMICSINKETHEVKLSSIMRDTAVVYDDLDEHNGTYRINAANYFGGPKYAMQIVNECFDMNIEHYVTVNFFGFQKIAEALGGIEMDITKEEMEQINKNQKQQARIAHKAGIDESDLVNELLTTYGEDTHLNGRQTLAYARIRKIDSDFTRAERQRKVLSALMKKMKTLSGPDIIALGMSMFEYVDTNLSLDDILNVALGVLSSDFDGVETFRLPINDSYKQETRNDESMFYDCDWEANSRELYTFIYE
ncbi:MAG: LCP family protein [Clostridia bacterium]|nr:LCP family protein [Clostridia bacterium]